MSLAEYLSKMQRIQNEFSEVVSKAWEKMTNDMGRLHETFRSGDQNKAMPMTTDQEW